jgi:hypothetical protein
VAVDSNGVVGSFIDSALKCLWTTHWLEGLTHERRRRTAAS